MSKPKDAHIAPISDLHSGGSTALFPHPKELQGGFWQFQHTRYTPSAKQEDMALHWDYCADITAERREGKRLVIVLNGDMIDGKHHQTLQLCSHNPDEQALVNIWLLKRFMKRAGFDKRRGDLLYVVTGTESHTGDVEQDIADELGAELNPTGNAYDFLELKINNKINWFLHQGAGPGKGQNLGDGLRNWLKAKYWSILESQFWMPEQNAKMPDIVVSGHYHVPVQTSYDREHHKIDGLLLPSFQTKTRFGFKVAAAELENIGITSYDVPVDGDIKIYKPLRMKNRDDMVEVE